MASSTPLAAHAAQPRVPLWLAADSPATASIMPDSWAATEPGAVVTGVASATVVATATVGVVAGAGAAVGVGAVGALVGADGDGDGVGLTGAGIPTGIPIGAGPSTDTSEKQKREGRLCVIPSEAAFQAERGISQTTCHPERSRRDPYPRTLPSTTLSISRVVPTYAATATRAPRETSATGSSVSGSTISK